MLAKKKAPRRGKSDRKTSQLKSRPQSKRATSEKQTKALAARVPRVIEQQSDSEARDQSDSEAESTFQQTFEAPVVSVVESIAPQRACHTK